jgi:hypothetical protein
MVLVWGALVWLLLQLPLGRRLGRRIHYSQLHWQNLGMLAVLLEALEELETHVEDLVDVWKDPGGSLALLHRLEDRVFGSSDPFSHRFQ